MRMLVLGAGLQGSACAYDLLQDKEVTEVRLADVHVGHLPDFLAPFSGPRLLPTPLDVRDHDAVLGAMRECDAVMSAIPYYFNFDLAELAVEAGVHFCDLGGNTEIVFKQKELDAEARAKNITVVPDCGLAPGMVNILAEYGISQLDTVESVKIFVGGLPQHPEPPLNYMLVYSLEGALDYYTTLSWVLRDGKRTQVKALSEREPVKFDAARRARGVSHGRRSVHDGVSLRGQDSDDGVQDASLSRARAADGRHSRARSARQRADRRRRDTKVVPRDVSSPAVQPKLTKPKGRDLVALRVVVTGTKDGKPATRTLRARRSIRREARRERDDAHDGLLAVDHGTDAGARRGQAGGRAHAG